MFLTYYILNKEVHFKVKAIRRAWYSCIVKHCRLQFAQFEELETFTCNLNWNFQLSLTLGIYIPGSIHFCTGPWKNYIET